MYETENTLNTICIENFVPHILTDGGGSGRFGGTKNLDWHKIEFMSNQFLYLFEWHKCVKRYCKIHKNLYSIKNIRMIILVYQKKIQR